ncbi:MAG: ATP synthase F0 subunit B [Myxococcota bacterium]|nr:ATP synthase F0 subunit B [Myxococcota bacterium]
MNIIPIPTLLVLQLIPFLITLVALYFIIFAPMLRYLDERSENIAGARSKATELEKQSEEKLQELNDRLQKIRSDLNDKRMTVRAELMANYNETIYQARQEADKEIKAQVALLSEEQEAARKELQNQAKAIAELVANQTLGRSIAS